MEIKKNPDIRLNDQFRQKIHSNIKKFKSQDWEENAPVSNNSNSVRGASPLHAALSLLQILQKIILQSQPSCYRCLQHQPSGPHVNYFLNKTLTQSAIHITRQKQREGESTWTASNFSIAIPRLQNALPQKEEKQCFRQHCRLSWT